MPELSEGLGSVDNRPHWTVVGEQASFAPVAAGWRGVVSRLQRPTGGARYHIAVIDRTGRVRSAANTASLDDAVRIAESSVLARNALRLVPGA